MPEKQGVSQTTAPSIGPDTVIEAFGIKLLVDDLDQPPAKVADQAPWTGTDKKPPPLQ